MTEKQIKKYEELSKLKEQYEEFIETDGDICIVRYSSCSGGALHYKIDDYEFKSLVKNLARERLAVINKKIEEL